MLEVTKSILKCTVTHFRILKGAFMGSILFCIVVVIPNVWVIVKIVVGFFLITAYIFWYTFCIKDWKRLVRFLIALYLTVIITGGSIAVLSKWIPIRILNTIEFVPIILIVTIIVKCFIHFVFYRTKEEICNVILGVGGKEIPIIAFIDNGNGLIDPISKKPVSVTERVVFTSEIELLPEKYRVIPFHALGTEKGILDGYEMDYLKIERDGRKTMIEKPIIAISNGYVSGKKNYQMILHSELLKESEDSV